MKRFAVRAAIEAVEARTLFAAPVVDSIPNQSVPVGKTIQIPVTSTSSAAVTYSVRDSSGNVSGGFRANSTYIQMRVAGYADPMVFQLFGDTAPDTVRRITGLVNAKFYDGLTFHRILNNFVIQGGDPDGDGSGGPEFTFDDEFDVNTTFTGTGQLAMANSGKDTNGSQFFITEGPQRLLDFNHTIFGQLVRGEATRQAISNVTVDGNGSPGSDVIITSVRVLADKSDGVLLMKATAAGSYNVRVTATNADGSTSRSFTLTAAADTINDPPILNTSTLQKVYYTTAGTPVSLNLSSIDAENDAGFFQGQYLDQNGSTGAYGGTNSNVITITPGAGTSGLISFVAGAADAYQPASRGSTSANSSSVLGGVFDTQAVRIAVGDLPISVSAVNIEAPAGGATGQILIGTIRDTDTASLASTLTAQIDWGDGDVTTGTVTKLSAGRFGVYADKTYAAKANGTLPITLTVTGDLGAFARATSTATVRTPVALSDGTLTINGTAGRDSIAVSRKKRQYVVTVNRVNYAYAYSDVSIINAYGYGGNDLIGLTKYVLANTYLDGGDGNDSISGGVGDNVINAGAGNDVVYAGNGLGAIANRVAGGEGNDTINGGNGRDRFFGGLGDDSIVGAGGRDILAGDEGNDIIVGGAGNDSLYGYAGNDILNGLTGTDLIDGGDGNDTAKEDSLDTRISIEVLV